jgi:hypothetical protein
MGPSLFSNTALSSSPSSNAAARGVYDNDNSFRYKGQEGEDREWLTQNRTPSALPSSMLSNDFSVILILILIINITHEEYRHRYRHRLVIGVVVF